MHTPCSEVDEVAEHESVDIAGEQVPASAKLATKFAFGTHPHVLHVLSVDVFVVRVDEVSFMDYNFVHIYPTSNGAYISVCCPPIRNNVTAWKNILPNFCLQCSRSTIRYVNEEAFAQPPFNSPENPMTLAPLTSMVFSMEKFALVDFDSNWITIVVHPPISVECRST